MNNHMEKIPVFAEFSQDMDYLSPTDTLRQLVFIDVGKFQNNIKDFLNTMEQVIPNAIAQVNKFHISEVHINVEISGEGQIGILGMGITGGASAGLTFVLKLKE